MSGYGFGGVDEFMFNFVPLFVIGFFVFIFGIIIYSIIESVKNKQKPIIPVRAKVVAKRTKVSGGSHTSDNNMHTSASTYYYATFEFENGERMELSIPADKIGYLIEGDMGTLSLQGDSFTKFERVNEENK